MKVDLKRVNQAVLLEARNSGGNLISIDGSEKVGGTDGGFRPMELLLAGLGGCGAMDVISILKKQGQKLVDVEIQVEGERENDPNKATSVFVKIHQHYILWGDLDAGKVERALELGIHKYCSAGEMLGKTAEITHSYEIKPVRKGKCAERPPDTGRHSGFGRG